jgi:CheY-specific phosphatase CheX
MNTKIAEWVDAMVESTIEFAEQMLGATDAHVVGPLAQEPGSVGAYIAIVGDESVMQLGVVALREDGEGIARTLLMMEPGEELSLSDLADAIGEVVNVIAGGVKSRLNDREPGLILGLPLFVDGRVVTTPSVELAGQAVSINGTDLQLVVIRQPK